MAVAAHPTPLDLTDLHRLVTPDGALDTEDGQLTLQMRSREAPAELFDELHERGSLVIHETMDDARAVITDDAIDEMSRTVPQISGCRSSGVGSGEASLHARAAR